MTAQTTEVAANQPKTDPVRVGTGYILTNSDAVSIEESLVGTCVQFPSGRIAGELQHPHTGVLEKNVRHYHWRDADRAVEALEEALESDVWIEWSR